MRRERRVQHQFADAEDGAAAAEEVHVARRRSRLHDGMLGRPSAAAVARGGRTAADDGEVAAAAQNYDAAASGHTADGTGHTAAAAAEAAVAGTVAALAAEVAVEIRADAQHLDTRSIASVVHLPRQALRPSTPQEPEASIRSRAAA